MRTVNNRFNFIFLLLAAEMLCFVVNCLLKRCLRRNGRRRRHGRGRALAVGVVRVLDRLRLPRIIIATMLLCGASSAVCAIPFSGEEPGEERTYVRTEIAEQKDKGILFETEQIKSEAEADRQTSRNMLHIPEFYLGKTVTLERFEYFEAVLGSVYRQGDQVEYVETTLPLGAVYDDCDSPYIEEAVYYREVYRNYSSRDNHYQYGRALTDAGMMLDGVPFAHKLAMMDDSVSALEELTVYREWNAGTEDEPAQISACFLAFSNGKLFLHNAPLAAGSEVGVDYVSWFYVEAYICFCQGKERIVERDAEDENRLYALLCYYIGDAGESLLERIDKEAEPVLYCQVYDEALANYREAEKRYKDNPAGYKEEPGIMTRIENGITTLEGKELPKT